MINLASDNADSMEKMCAVQQGTGSFASWDITDPLETRFKSDPQACMRPQSHWSQGDC